MSKSTGYVRAKWDDDEWPRLQAVKLDTEALQREVDGYLYPAITFSHNVVVDAAARIGVSIDGTEERPGPGCCVATRMMLEYARACEGLWDTTLERYAKRLAEPGIGAN